MGFIKAFTGALEGTFADQWEEYLVPMSGAPSTAGIIPAVQQSTNAGRGVNTKGSVNIISDGSKFVVPDNFLLVTMQDGGITGYTSEPGGFIFKTNDPNAKSVFAGDGIIASLASQTFERFKFGGIPSSQQTAFYVNLKEIPGNRFGTQSEIYWDDAYLNTQVGAIMRGTYSLRIVDPLLFVKNFVPIDYLMQGKIFDFADTEENRASGNTAVDQLFDEVVGSLSAAFSIYTNDPSRGNRITKIQSDQIGFAQSLSQAVEEGYRWKSDRGLEIVKVAIQAIEYDEDSRKLISDVKRADAFTGARGNTFMQQSVARGMEAAGQNAGGMGMAFMGMGLNASSGVMGALQQPVSQQPNYQQQGYQQPVSQQPNYQQQGYQQPVSQQPNYQQPDSQPINSQPEEDPYERLAKYKRMLDEGLITQEDYDEQKKKILGV